LSQQSNHFRKIDLASQKITKPEEEECKQGLGFNRNRCNTFQNFQHGGISPIEKKHNIE
jgi:hypothetical protein